MADLRSIGRKPAGHCAIPLSMPVVPKRDFSSYLVVPINQETTTSN